MLVKWFRGLSGRVNTSHHQAVKDPAPSFNVTAKANDGVIEAIEAKDHPFAVGVQWHPEILYRKDAPAAALFKALIQAANQFSKRRRER
jgi:putative glutamine amidotransferase